MFTSKEHPSSSGFQLLVGSCDSCRDNPQWRTINAPQRPPQCSASQESRHATQTPITMLASGPKVLMHHRRYNAAFTPVPGHHMEGQRTMNVPGGVPEDAPSLAFKRHSPYSSEQVFQSVACPPRTSLCTLKLPVTQVDAPTYLCVPQAKICARRSGQSGCIQGAPHRAEEG